jgi:GNAT superfamily N-acetyltransferase
MTAHNELEKVDGVSHLPRCVPWEEKYREGVLALFSDVPHKRQLWHWQFEANPFLLPFNPVVLVDEKDQVAGFNGVMPVKATKRGEQVEVLWSCDFYLAKHWRGQGFGSQIKHELHRTSSIIMALGISDQASHVLRHLGWVPDDSVRSFRMVRRARELRSLALWGLQLINRIRGRAGLLDRRFTYSQETSFSTHSFLPEKDHVDRLWRECAATYDWVVEKSYQYLDWRYQKHPLGRYGFVHAEREGELVGILIVRTHSEHLRIVDYVGPSNDGQLKQALVDYAVNRWRHVAQVSVMTSDSQLSKCLLAVGFVQLRGKPRFFRFEEKPSQMPWFIMAGDSDGEFLQAASEFCSVGAT